MVAFCNACGATLDPSSRFCAKCGAARTPAATAATTPVPVGAPPPKSTSGAKTILTIVAVVVGLGILGVVAVGVIGWQIARHSRVQNERGKVRVETPFGTVESNQDADEAAKNLGVEVYPGARGIKGSAASVSFGNLKTVNAEFETSDRPDQVADFYKQKYPNANVTDQSQNRYSIIAIDSNATLTINIEPRAGATHIQIANVSKPTQKNR